MITLNNGIALTTLSTAFLYATHTAFIHGYFSELSLDGDILYINFHQTIYEGMAQNAYWIVIIPFFYFIATLLFGALKCHILSHLSGSYPKKRKFRSFKKLLRLKTRKSNIMEQQYQKSIKHSGLIALTAIMSIFVLAHFEQNGKTLAKEKIDDIKSNNYAKVQVQLNSNNYELAHLYCGVKNCAGLNAGTNKIVYYPLSGHTYVPKK